MQFQRIWSLIAALVLGAIGTFGLVAYVRQAHDDTTAGQKLVPVYVATDKIAAGTPAGQLASKVKLEQVPAKVRAEGAVTDLDELKNHTAAVDIVGGEQLLASRFVKAGDQAHPVLSSIPVPAGLFQTTISLEPDQALGGQVRAGNRVAIIASNTANVAGAGTAETTTAQIVARDVLITTVQVDGEAGEGADQSQQVINAPTGKFLVTIAVAQPELESVVAAMTDGDGQVWLAADPGAK